MKKDEKRGQSGKAALGKAAPDFTLTDLDGKAVKLSDFKGKIVVLEWFNPDCPFVKAAHAEGRRSRTWRERHAKDGVVWLAINSGAPGQARRGRASRTSKARRTGSMDYPVLLDETGEVGKLYGAKTTPHMYVIDAKGDARLPRRDRQRAERQGRRRQARQLRRRTRSPTLKAGKPVATAETKAYGCSVKYDKKPGT